MKWQKLLVCGVIVSNISLGFAEETEDKTEEERLKQERKQQRHYEEKKYLESKLFKLADTYIPSLKNPVNIWVHADLLYWVPKIRSMDYTTKKSDVLVTDNFTRESLVNSDFEWQPGFQAGVGYLFKNTHWDLAFLGTHYHSWTEGSRSTHDNQLEGMFPIWSLSSDTLPGDYVTFAKIKGRLTFNRLLFQGGYYFEVNRRFVIRPWVGLEVASLKQHYDVEYQGGIFSSGTDYIHLKNNFWGAGPQAGIYPWLYLGQGWNLFGKASFSWLYGCFKVNQRETYLNNVRYSSDHDFLNGSISTDTEAGIEWKCLFYHGKFSFATKLSWEYLVYFRQNQMKRDPYNKLSAGGVQMQGAVLSILFDF